MGDLISGDRRVLVFSAHAADFCSRAGGTIARLTEAGSSVHIVDFSYGERCESPALWARDPQPSIEEIKRLRAKLTKSKSLVESLNQKQSTLHESLKAVEGKLSQQIEMNVALRNELNEIRRNQDKVDKSEVTDILARVKVAGIGYTLLQENSGKTTWHQDQQIVKIQE